MPVVKAGEGSVVVSVERPYEGDGVTPRDDLIGMRVWISTSTGFNPVDANGLSVLTPSYDGTSLNCVIPDQTPGVTVYVRYALISSIDPTYNELSPQYAVTPKDSAETVVGSLTNDSHTVPADSSGTVLSFSGASTSMSIYIGQTDDTANWTFSATKTNVTTSEPSTSRVQTVTDMTADTGYVDITASRPGYASITKRFNVTKSKAGANGSAGSAGSPGAAATAYWMLKSAGAVAQAVGGALTPSTITFSAMSQTGAGAATAYAGRFIIATSTDGVNFTNQYTSAANESSKAYTLPAGIKAVRARLYLAGGTTTLLDEELVPVVSDGATGAPGAQGPSVVLVASRAGSFTSTDGTLDASQADITFTALVNGIVSPTFAWTLSGFETAPTASTTNSQTITAAQFGNSKSATVKCTVNGNDAYVGMATVVRLEKSTAAAGANNTYVDANGVIQGVSSGAGKAVSNENITLSKDGVLSGAGASEQLDITYIPGTLSADRIKTGVLSADASILIGDAIQGVEIEAATESIKVKGPKAYTICLFASGASTPNSSRSVHIDGAYGLTFMYSKGWSDYLTPDQVVDGKFYLLVGTVERAGQVTWNTEVLLNLGNPGGTFPYAVFAVSTSPTTSPSTYSAEAIQPAAGQYVWMRRYSWTGSAYTLVSTIMVSSEDDKRVSYSPVQIGKFTFNNLNRYGILGKDSSTSSVWKLDDDGLWLSRNAKNNKILGISKHYTHMMSADEWQYYQGASPSATGTVTSYIKIAELVDAQAFSGIGVVFKIFVLGEFNRRTNSSGVITSYAASFKEIDALVRGVNTGTNILVNQQDVAGYTTDSSNFALSKITVIVDETGSVAGSTGVFVKLISRTMYDLNNPTYSDECGWHVGAWKYSSLERPQ